VPWRRQKAVEVTGDRGGRGGRGPEEWKAVDRAEAVEEAEGSRMDRGP
jgi:hypothetical protein